MKLWSQLLILTILDFIVIWIWVRQEDPDPSVTIGILLVVPLVIIVNLVLAGIFYAIKRQYANAFLINSLIAALIMYNLFIAGIDRHQHLRYESWIFKINDTTFNITHSRRDSSFSIDYSTHPGTSSSYLSGRSISKRNLTLLTSDTSALIIKANYLFGFRHLDSIKLTKIAR